MTPIIECNNLTRKYGKKVALDHVNLSIEPGQIIGLLGPNGSGKTTLIKLINGLLVPNEGSILINNMKPGPETKAKVSYLPDISFLNENKTIFATIELYVKFYSDFDSRRAFEMLDKVNIDPMVRIKTLSKGNKEKVQLILVMCRDADLYVLDEPIGGVDPAARDYILDTIISNYNPNATILISTHLISDIESILDYVIFIKDGAITLSDSVDNIRSKEEHSIDGLFREVFKC